MWHIIELFVHRVVVQKEDDDWENDRTTLHKFDFASLLLIFLLTGVRMDLETFERLHQVLLCCMCCLTLQFIVRFVSGTTAVVGRRIDGDAQICARSTSSTTFLRKNII